MSILLDALKKSEKQRQLGQTPNLHTVVETDGAETASEQQWPALSMLALSAVAIAWFGWQQFQQPAETAGEPGVDVVAIPEVETAPVVDTPAEESRRPAEQPVRGGGKRQPPPSLWNMKKGMTGLTVLPADSPTEARERKEKLSRSFSSYQAEKDPVAEQTADHAMAADGKVELPPVTVASTSSKPAVDQPAANQSGDSEKAPLAAALARRSSRLQPHESEPISFWQIPQALRDGLPEFRINVLVYAEKPEDRFLLINGQRLVEKEELADGIVLDEIRRDGAVFRYRNYRFLVKG